MKQVKYDLPFCFPYLMVISDVLQGSNMFPSPLPILTENHLKIGIKGPAANFVTATWTPLWQR